MTDFYEACAVLDSLHTRTPRRRYMDDLKAIADLYSLPLQVVLGDERTRMVVNCRIDCIHMLRGQYKMTAAQIARAIGRDNSSIHYILRTYGDPLGLVKPRHSV